MGTMNYSKYSEKRKDFVFDMVFPNTYGKIIKLLAAMNEAGVKPELECFDTGHTHGHLAAARHGRAEAAAPVLVHRQRARRHPRASSRRCSCRRRSCRPGSEWEVIGISHGAVAHDRRGARRSAATSARASRTTSISRAARWRSRNGELVEVRGAHGRATCGASAGDGRGDLGQILSPRKPALASHRASVIERSVADESGRRRRGHDDHAPQPGASQRDRAGDGQRAALRARRRARPTRTCASIVAHRRGQGVLRGRRLRVR